MVCLLVNVLTVPSAVALVDKAAQTTKNMGNDENTFIFAGRCPNGQAYRLFSYQAEVEGLTQSFYDYEGPAGKGTVKTQATPKTVAVRVCRALAEIAND
jgi:hypothetical protein